MKLQLAASLCLLIASAAQATTITTGFNNISSNPSGSFANFQAQGSGWGQRFYVTNTGSISQVQFNLFKGGTTGLFTYVRITGDSGGLPDFGQTLFSQTLTDSQVPVNRPNYVTLTPNVAVTGSTNYWLTLNVSDQTQGFNYGWEVGPFTNADLSQPPYVPAGSFKQAAYITGTGPWATNTSQTAAFGMSVEVVQVVPEPSAAILGGCGGIVVAGCWTLRRRKRA